MGELTAPPFFAVIVTKAAPQPGRVTGHAEDIVVAVHLTDDLAEAQQLQMRMGTGARYPYPEHGITVAAVTLTKPWAAPAVACSHPDSRSDSGT